jgi:hypothetical protein
MEKSIILSNIQYFTLLIAYLSYFFEKNSRFLLRFERKKEEVSLTINLIYRE